VERLALPATDIRIAGRSAPCETLFAYAGAFQLTLSTALPDEGVQLHSSYLGHQAVERSSASHLLIGPGAPPRLWTVEHGAATLPVMNAHRHCLLIIPPCWPTSSASALNSRSCSTSRRTRSSNSTTPRRGGC
jgi:hypothetical protein